MSDTETSPLMRQYREIKRGYPEAILLFRVGDFYEMFYEDAQIASKLLSIALTSRDKSSANPVTLCGVPYHAVQGYIAKLLKAGRTVALCEQVEDPKLAKGLVRREVVRLYTPGTLIDTEFLSPGESHFLAAVAFSDATIPSAKPQSVIGLACLDVSTGEFWMTEFQGTQAEVQLMDELARLEPRELLYSDSQMNAGSCLTRLRGPRLCAQSTNSFNPKDAAQLLQAQFAVHSLDGFGCRGLTVGIGAAGAVLRYVRETQPTASLAHLRRIHTRWSGDAMHLDRATIRNLELVRPLEAGEHRLGQDQQTVLSVLDRTATAMGSRLLREWLIRPLLDRGAIHARLEAVGELKDRIQQRVSLRTTLRDVQDIARLGSRVTLGVAGPRELLALKQSVSALPELRSHLKPFGASLLVDVQESWDDCRDVHDMVEQAVKPDAPMALRDGGVIREGYHAGVDELRKASTEGKGWIASLEAKERERTGIDSLKVRYNQVFGYYIEITKTHLSRIPPDYIRKQTLVNAERFMTPELKELEERVSGAEIKLLALEQELFEQLRLRLAHEVPRLQAMAQTVALLDVLAGLAETAALHRYVKPLVDESSTILIREGRHPVVEQLSSDRTFIPNDTVLDCESNRLVILTGPNMAGKSTYLRQIALIVLLAQIGSFVPAAEARIGLVDRIFTRVGASDNLAAGQSTFMVEMIESAHILNSATSRSLILLDEIGRGTSTYDGLSIAWAIAEHIQDRRHLGARTLFATHYHEMTQLEGLREGIRNYCVAVQERDGDVVFLRKIVPGGADRSYGIHVAKLAGLPQVVIARAQQVLAQLEQPDAIIDDRSSTSEEESPRASLPHPHPIIEEMKQIDLFSMTPLDALNRLADLQRRIGPTDQDDRGK
ncbi:MAG TPA: DNA mismatch repair protein MutS [Nitrospiraceae bacterium]|nr:DNA mismatch repair protein MutS [Nitrospiraceae bacterium]